MKTLLITPFFILLTSFSSCKKAADNSIKAGEFKDISLTASQKSLLAKTNDFAFTFFREVNSLQASPVNLMVSPLSVSMALGMARNGAANLTLTDMTSTLGFQGMADNDINESYKYILDTFTGLDPLVTVNIANCIWYRNTFTPESAFLTTNTNYFKSQVTPLDFSNASAKDIINAWVKEKTNSKIEKIVDQIPASMVMYLVNAVYFNGTWEYAFDKSATSSRPFYLSDGTTVQANAMVQKKKLNYLSVNDFSALELPYGQGNFNMYVLLPNQGVKVSQVVSELTSANWDTWLTQFSLKEANVQLPKFTFSYEENHMKPILSDMGMGIAFDDQKADFTRINKNGGLFISEVKHKTFVDVNEKGTEAAAVTSIGVGITAIGPDSPVYFVVDRPFIFLIREKSTGSVLFIGTVVNPTAS